MRRINAVEAFSDAKQHSRPPRTPLPLRVYLAVHRYDDDLYYKRLSRDEYAVLSAIGDGLNLAQACDAGLRPSQRDKNELAADIRNFGFSNGRAWDGSASL
jgi:hypothetical protein